MLTVRPLRRRWAKHTGPSLGSVTARLSQNILPQPAVCHPACFAAISLIGAITDCTPQQQSMMPWRTPPPPLSSSPALWELLHTRPTACRGVCSQQIVTTSVPRMETTPTCGTHKARIQAHRKPGQGADLSLQETTILPHNYPTSCQA